MQLQHHRKSASIKLLHKKVVYYYDLTILWISVVWVQNMLWLHSSFWEKKISGATLCCQYKLIKLSLLKKRWIIHMMYRRHEVTLSVTWLQQVWAGLLCLNLNFRIDTDDLKGIRKDFMKFEWNAIEWIPVIQSGINIKATFRTV